MTIAQDSMATMKARIREKIQHQYKESSNLRGMIDVVLDEVELVGNAMADMLDHFDLDTAVGDQLTIIGTNIGWPRFHCNGRLLLPSLDTEDYTFDDDELYRKFIKAKRFRNRSNGSIDEFMESAQALFGNQIYPFFNGQGHFILGLNREATNEELELFPLYRLVLPQIRATVLQFRTGENPFGFGQGWSGFCEGEFGKTVL